VLSAISGGGTCSACPSSTPATALARSPMPADAASNDVIKRDAINSSGRTASHGAWVHVLWQKRSALLTRVVPLRWRPRPPCGALRRAGRCCRPRPLPPQQPQAPPAGACPAPWPLSPLRQGLMKAFARRMRAKSRALTKARWTEHRGIPAAGTVRGRCRSRRRRRWRHDGRPHSGLPPTSATDGTQRVQLAASGRQRR